VKLESSFDVPAPRQEAWELLMDVPRIVPCMPGATLKEEVSENQWKAELAVKLGPIALTFDTDIERASSDEVAGRVTLNAKAKEKRARGRANATIESSLTEIADGTRVDIVTELALSGAVAQYGRGVVHDVSEQMVGQFAACLRKQLAAATPVEAAAVAAEPAKPVGGLRIGLRALWRALGRTLKRPFVRTPTS
jgi:carbon monoxide dehydrogenase subunit G